FPGNVRELRNVIEQASVLSSGGAILPGDLWLDGEPEAAPAAGGAFTPGVPFADAKKTAVERFEREFLGEALRRNGANVSRTAEAVGMVRQSLQQKLRELGLRGGDGDAQ
ncbi:MAG: sigma-54-dependent Fis family transcriptional regulator, partial [Deltaproteobacteria bacterium]|nr:sigma-54-dependent Fis family transcriptional regulator [Deltaproteobacteria bacterium]